VRIRVAGARGNERTGQRAAHAGAVQTCDKPGDERRAGSGDAGEPACHGQPPFVASGTASTLLERATVNIADHASPSIRKPTVTQNQSEVHM